MNQSTTYIVYIGAQIQDGGYWGLVVLAYHMWPYEISLR